MHYYYLQFIFHFEKNIPYFIRLKFNILCWIFYPSCLIFSNFLYTLIIYLLKELKPLLHLLFCWSCFLNTKVSGWILYMHQLVWLCNSPHFPFLPKLESCTHLIFISLLFNHVSPSIFLLWYLFLSNMLLLLSPIYLPFLNYS